MVAKNDKLTGIQKSAILFITLGPDASAGILKKLPEKDIQKIIYEIANITSVKADQKQAILDEFMEMNKAKDFLLEGGIEYARNLLSKAVGTQKAKGILDKVMEETQRYRPFSILRKADANQLLYVIVNEHPQTIALIMCYMQADKAAQIMAALPLELQSEVSYRIATMSSISPIDRKSVV